MNTLFFAPNPSSKLKSKYWRFQSMCTLKIDFGTILIFWLCIPIIQNPVFRQLVLFDMYKLDVNIKRRKQARPMIHSASNDYVINPPRIACISSFFSIGSMSQHAFSTAEIRQNFRAIRLLRRSLAPIMVLNSYGSFYHYRPSNNWITAKWKLVNGAGSSESRSEKNDNQ